MHTRCPQCHTTFVVNPAQLAARDGLVRCGRCRAVFQAEKYRVQKPATRAATANPPNTNPAAVARRKPARKHPSKTAGDAGKRRKTAVAGDAVPGADDHPEPLQLALPGMARGPQTRMPFWVAGNLLLLMLLFGQGVYFYTSDLARLSPPLKPALERLCAVLGCRLTPPQDVSLIDLVEARVAPHPKFNKALRIRATLVNRAAFPQAFPAMEVTLSDNNGQVIARRTFKPDEYLEKSRASGQLMPTNVAVPVLLDVTHPDNRALGYEIRLLPAD